MTGSVDAGTSALETGRWADARAAFAAALADEVTPDALRGMGAALWWLGDMPGSVEHHERAYTAFRRAGRRVDAGLTAVGLAFTYAANFADHAAAGGWAARAGRLLADDPDPGLRAWLELARGYATEDARAALVHRSRSLELARSARDADLELCSLTAVGEALVLTGRVADGLALVDEAMAATLAGEPDRLDTVAYTCCDMIVSCSVAGDLQRAAAWCRRADGFIARYGCPFLYARCRISYGLLLVATGDWAEAEAQLLSATAMAAAAGPALATEAAAALAQLRLRQGRLDEAAGLLSPIADAPAAAAPLAALRLAEGAPQLAVPLLRRRLRTVVAAAEPALLALLVEAQLASSDLDAAAATAIRLALASDRTRHDGVRAQAALAAARVAAHTGDRAAAAGLLEEALGLFVRLGRAFEAAVVHRELAAVLAPDRPEVAVAEGRAALDSFEDLGALREADATAALLRDLGAGGRRLPRSREPLTRREAEVLELLALGLSNPEIAQRLYISRKTAAHHVSAVLAKLGVRRRAEAAALAAVRAPSAPARPTV